MTGLEPSRPIVLIAPDGGSVFAGHTVYDRRRERPHARGDYVVFGRVEVSAPEVIRNPTRMIAPDPALQSQVNNVTGPKAPCPADGPWIVSAIRAAGSAATEPA